MTSSKDMKAGSALQSSGEERRRAPLDQLPPPANSNKPLTPFSIEDILNRPSVKKSVASICPPRVLEKVTGSNSGRNGITTPSSPLCALEELASKTFKGLEVSVIQAAEGTNSHEPNRNVSFLGRSSTLGCGGRKEWAPAEVGLWMGRWGTVGAAER